MHVIWVRGKQASCNEGSHGVSNSVPVAAPDTVGVVGLLGGGHAPWNWGYSDQFVPVAEIRWSLDRDNSSAPGLYGCDKGHLNVPGIESEDFRSGREHGIL